MLHEREPHMMVNREDLIYKLKENRENHEAKYNDMCKGYKVLIAECNEDFQEKLIKALEEKEPHEVDHSILYRECFKTAVKPVDHFKDYDDTILMLEWIKEDLVSISLQQFKSWVGDEWPWYGAFEREGQLSVMKSTEYHRRFE